MPLTDERIYAADIRRLRELHEASEIAARMARDSLWQRTLTDAAI